MTTKLKLAPAGIVLIFSGMMFSCNDSCKTTYSYKTYEPVYKTASEIRNGVSLKEPEKLGYPGKIYLFNYYLFINEAGKGIHIIDDADPSSPVNKSFLNIPGNFDMAARDNMLYADSYMDLLVFDITDVSNVILIKRLENIFQDSYPAVTNPANGEPSVITEFLEKQEQTVYDNCEGIVPSFLDKGGQDFFLAAANANRPANFTPNNMNPGGTGTGVGSSMARFAIVNDALYTVGSYRLNVFDIYNPSNPEFIKTADIGWGIETIFPYKNNLFIGAQNGMHIFNVSEAGDPEYISTFAHVNSCDPVVVNDSVAFVTLRSGNACQGFTNELDVIDIKNLYNPRLIKSYAMTSPYGLGLNGNILFLCEGSSGLKVFDVSNLNDIGNHLLKHYENIPAFDVIPNNNLLILIGDNGLYQFDDSNAASLELLSQFSITTAGN